MNHNSVEEKKFHVKHSEKKSWMFLPYVSISPKKSDPNSNCAMRKK